MRRTSTIFFRAAPLRLPTKRDRPCLVWEPSEPSRWSLKALWVAWAKAYNGHPFTVYITFDSCCWCYCMTGNFQVNFRTSDSHWAIIHYSVNFVESSERHTRKIYGVYCWHVRHGSTLLPSSWNEAEGERLEGGEKIHKQGTEEISKAGSYYTSGKVNQTAPNYNNFSPR